MQATISNDRLISIFVQDSLLMDSCIDRKSDKVCQVYYCPKNASVYLMTRQFRIGGESTIAGV